MATRRGVVIAMSSALLAAPVLVKVLGSLGIVLLGNLLRVPLGVAILTGTLALGLWSGHDASAMLAIVRHKATAPDTLLLLVVLLLVMWLSAQMERCGVMRDLVATLCARFSPRASIAMLPAVIGVLPMHGGAVFSAPLVARCDPDGRIDPLLKTQINYWFRHVWEYWWPLYPGVLLAMQFTGLDVLQVMLLGLPLTAASVIGGYLFLLRRLPRAERIAPPPGERGVPLLQLLEPILLIIVVYAAVRLAWLGLQAWRPDLPRLDNFLPFILGVIIAILALQQRRPLGRATWVGLLRSPKAYGMAGIIFTLQLYSAFIDARLPGGMPLMAVMNDELTRWGIPLVAVMMVIPFVSGLTTGVAFGFVGASFPIVVRLLGADPAPAALLSSAGLAYGFGYLGMMCSPVHVCAIVTAGHFSAPLFRSLAGILRPAALVLLAIIAMHLAVKWLLAG